WQQGQADNGKYNKSKIVFDDRDPPEKIAQEQKGSDPYNSADHIEGSEAAILHGPDPGHKRGKSADDRYKAGVDNGLAPVLVIKPLGYVQVFLFEELVTAAESFGADVFTYMVIDHIPQHRCYDQQQAHQINIEI